MLRTSITTPFSRARAGLTLMELTVVMVILIALASILLPLLPSFLTKAHDVTTTTNISEIDKAVSGYFNANLAYPNYFDSLMTGTSIYPGMTFMGTAAALPAGPFTFLNSSSGTTGTGGATVLYGGTLTANQAYSLTLGGITNLMIMAATTGGNATYNANLGPPTTATAVAAVAKGTNVLFADNGFVYNRMNIPTVNDANGNPCYFVVFGLGQYSSMVGAQTFGVMDAPMSFGEHSFEQPTAAYARYLCVFRIFDDGQTRCQFVGCCHDDATGFGTYDMHMQEYYQTTQ
jgi:type II secretory pathway pseudopilin PulG